MNRQINTQVYGRASKRFAALLKKDRAKSLAQRWAHIGSEWPSLVSKLGYVELLLDRPGGLPGWAVVAVPEDSVAYTIGLQYHLGEPELLLSAPHLTAERQKQLLNQLVRSVFLGKRFSAGTRAQIGGKRVTFHRFEDATFKLYPCGIFARFEELFEDRFHTAGGTLPILWTKLSPGTVRTKRPVRSAFGKRAFR